MVEGRCWLAFATTLAFALALGLCACGEETVSVGDLRCVGKAIECDLKAPYGNSKLTPSNNIHDGIDAGAPEVLPEGEAEVVWTAELPCASEICGGGQLVIDEDGSLTFASEVIEPAALAPGTFAPESTVGGIWIARYDADGTLLAQSEELVLRNIDTHRPGTAVQPSLAALATTAWGTLLVAATEHRRSLYTIGADAEPESLWDLDLVVADELVSDGEELLVAATFYSPERGGSTAYPEVARYDHGGDLIWRQTALQGPKPKRTSEVGAVSKLPMVVSEDGQIFVVALDYSNSYREVFRRRLIALAPDGNIEWVGPSLDDPDGHNSDVALTSRGDIVVARAWYTLDLYHPVGDPAESLEIRSVSRRRAEYWDHVVLGFDIDAQDRPLIMTLEGDLDTPRFFIDRYSPDLSERQTFVFADSAIFDRPAGLRPTRASSLVNGMRLGPEGELYVWTSNRIFRVELP